MSSEKGSVLTLRTEKQVLNSLIKDYTQREVGEILGITQQQVQSKLKRYGIKTPLQHERNAKIDVTPRMREILLGAVLGDGHLVQSKGVNAYFRAEQGINQREYAEWKYRELKSLCKCKGLKEAYHLDKRSGKESYSVYFQTRTHPYLTELRELIYPKGKKIIPLNLQEIMSPLSLAVWYMDDGSKSKIQNQATLCVQGFSDNEIDLIQKVLLDKFQLSSVKKTTYDKRTEKYETNLTFNSASFIHLMSLIDKYKVDSLSYKFELKKIYPRIQREIDALATTMCQSPSQ